MNSGKTVFAQVTDFLPKNQFRHCVDRYKGNYRVRSFTCYDQYLCMLFAQLSYRESLRDIESCLRALDRKLYHSGFRGKVSRSTLADANETRDWRIYRDFAQLLILHAKDLYAGEDFGLQLDETVYALDASTIDLCLSVFPWAQFRKTKGAVKLHTLLDLRGNIPSFVNITDGKVHDVNVLDTIIPEAGAIYLMDRGYLDFERLFILNRALAFFIIPSKKNTKVRRLYSHPVDRKCDLRCDQTVVLSSCNSRKNYPEKLRRIRFFDDEQQRQLVFLTNNFILPPLTVTDLYRCRWQVELFFKWIKHHLRIKTFYGTSESAVKTQIWIAISAYVLVAILKKRMKIDLILYTILQVLSVTLFEKVPLLQILKNTSCKNDDSNKHIQLKLFDS